MSNARARRAVDLGDVEPARSRHAGRRSAVALTDDLVVAGTADGSLRAFDRATLDERWCVPGSEDSGSVVSIEPAADGIVVGERGAAGEIRCHDRHTGLVRWRRETADDLGPPQKDSRFFLPFVVALASDGERSFAAARRYERDADARSFTSVIYAFDPDGSETWRYETDASPIALDHRDRLAVAYNRCPGEHRAGLVVLDAATGEERGRWDPAADGERRVGDVSLRSDGAVVASHADYRGYRLDWDGTIRWRVDLGRPTDVGDETLYTYPNHVHATDEGAVFVTGNTYATEGRETDGLHPTEHTAVGVTPAGDRAWTADVGGFASEVAAAADAVAVPGAQHFRTRDATVHGFRVVDVADGQRAECRTDGVVAAIALDETSVAAVEEPVGYHDEDAVHGRYRLLVEQAA